MSHLEEVLPEFRAGAKIRRKCWVCGIDGVSKKENYSFHAYDVDADDWEVVPDKPIDWNDIIENKCLCQFWDDNKNIKAIGILAAIEENEYMPYLLKGGDYFMNCRPVHRDEVTFYEDKKDE